MHRRSEVIVMQNLLDFVANRYKTKLVGCQRKETYCWCIHVRTDMVVHAETKEEAVWWGQLQGRTKTRRSDPVE